MSRGKPVRSVLVDILQDCMMTTLPITKRPPSNGATLLCNRRTLHQMPIQKVEENICNALGTEESVSAHPIVLVRLKSEGREVLTYAMLNACSTRLFVLSDITAMLKVNGMETQLMVKTIKSVKLHNSKVLNGLVVTDLNGDHPVQLLKKFTKEDLSMPENIPSPELAHHRETS